MGVVLDVSTARTLITTSLDDDALDDVIDREEAWLARRIGPLVGERSEVFVTPEGDESLWLSRRTGSVLVVNGPDAIAVDDVELRGWSDVVSSGAWISDVGVTYEPDDEDEVRRSLITLVRLTVNESAYASQGAGGYTYAIDEGAIRRARFVAWRSLLRPRIPVSMRLRSGIQLGGRTIGTVQTSLPAS